MKLPLQVRKLEPFRALQGHVQDRRNLVEPLAIPVGWMLGALFAFLLNRAMTMDIFRIPLIITTETYAFSAAGVLVASVFSASTWFRL